MEYLCVLFYIHLYFSQSCLFVIWVTKIRFHKAVISITVIMLIFIILRGEISGSIQAAGKSNPSLRYVISS